MNQDSLYKCPGSGARFVFGEIGLKLLASTKVREQYAALDDTFSKTQDTMNFNNKYRNIQILVKEKVEESEMNEQTPPSRII